MEAVDLPTSQRELVRKHVTKPCGRQMVSQCNNLLFTMRCFWLLPTEIERTRLREGKGRGRRMVTVARCCRAGSCAPTGSSSTRTRTPRSRSRATSCRDGGHNHRSWLVTHSQFSLSHWPAFYFNEFRSPKLVWRVLCKSILQCSFMSCKIYTKTTL